jgi:hypothetical protein
MALLDRLVHREGHAEIIRGDDEAFHRPRPVADEAIGVGNGSSNPPVPMRKSR